jgi:hypothetical protein
MQKRITVSMFESDKERLAPYFKPGDTWAHAISKALDDIYGVPQKGESDNA